jgi:glutamate 5-kinase
MQVDISQTGTQWGTGGMATKLTAARMATAAGCHMAICLASEPERMLALLAGDKSCGTVFHPHPNMLRCLHSDAMSG